jgi:hypothetical protein
MPSFEHYREVAHGIADYLASRQRPDGAFPGPDHYGRAFAALLWSHFAGEYGVNAAAALRHLADHRPADHGEFNAYALLHYPDRAAVADLLRRLRFGRRHSANWMLLRAACRARPGPWYSRTRARLEARAALLRYGRKALIHDRPGALSHSYHAFCGALLVDLGRDLDWPWARERAIRAARALQPEILPDGGALRVGRGAEQIFGYGALLYLLEAAAAPAGDTSLRASADRVFGFLTRFRRADGSFPLVLNADEAPEPWLPDPSRPGWYDYNRYADYLPFLGVYLVKAGEVRSSQCAIIPRSPGHARSADGHS